MDTRYQHLTRIHLRDLDTMFTVIPIENMNEFDHSGQEVKSQWYLCPWDYLARTSLPHPNPDRS